MIWIVLQISHLRGNKISKDNDILVKNRSQSEKEDCSKNE